MDQDQNNNLFDNTPPPPPPGSEEPTFSTGNAQVYETPSDPSYQRPPEPVFTAPPPQYTAPGLPPQAPKSNRTWIIILIVVLVLCCCCLLVGAFMWFVGGDWLINQLNLNSLAPSLTMLA